MSFEQTQPVWYEDGHERRLLFYDVFRGMFGKVWALGPLFATAWTETENLKPTFRPDRPPVSLVSTREEEGFITDVLLDQGSHHYLLDSYVVYPRILRFNWQATLFEFDVSGEATEMELFYTVIPDGERHRIRLQLPPPPERRFFCAEATLMRDDNLILQEWLGHCEQIGVDRFLLYDNMSPEPPDLSAHPSATLIDWPYPYYHRDPPGYEVSGRWGEGLGLGSQVPQQIHALYKHGVESDWMAFFDTDEYLNLAAHPDLHSLLDPEEARTLIHIPSFFYGNAPVDGATSIRSRYLKREPPGEMNGFGYNRRKAIVNTRTLLNGEHVVVHEFTTERDPESWRIQQPFQNDVRRQLGMGEARLNHYFSVGLRRRDTEWPAPYYCSVDDDSILAMVRP